MVLDIGISSDSTLDNVSKWDIRKSKNKIVFRAQNDLNLDDAIEMLLDDNYLPHTFEADGKYLVFKSAYSVDSNSVSKELLDRFESSKEELKPTFLQRYLTIAKQEVNNLSNIKSQEFSSLKYALDYTSENDFDSKREIGNLEYLMGQNGRLLTAMSNCMTCVYDDLYKSETQYVSTKEILAAEKLGIEIADFKKDKILFTENVRRSFVCKTVSDALRLEAGIEPLNKGGRL